MKELGHKSPFRAPLPQISGLQSGSFHRHGLMGAEVPRHHGIMFGAPQAATHSDVLMKMSDDGPEPPVTGKAFSFLTQRNSLSYSAHSLQRQSTSRDPPAPPPPTLGPAPPLAERFSSSAESLFSRQRANLFSDEQEMSGFGLRGCALEEEPVRQDQPMKDAPPAPLDEASDVHVERRMHKSRGRPLAKPEEDGPLYGSSWGGQVHMKELAQKSPLRAPLSQISGLQRITLRMPPPPLSFHPREQIAAEVPQRQSAMYGTTRAATDSDVMMMMMNNRATEPPVTGKAFSFGNALSDSAHSLQRQSTSRDPPAPPPPTLGPAPPLAERFSSSAASLFSTAQLLFSDEQEMEGFGLGGCALEEQDQPMKDAPPVSLDEASDVDVERRRHKSRDRSSAMLEEDEPLCGSSWGGRVRSKGLFKSSRMRQSADQPFERKSADPEALKLRWTEIFQMQHSEGYWQFTAELGELINLDVDLFANVFLKNKGIQSLGVKAHADILKLVATLLVLQLMREEKIEEGKLLRTLFCLDDSPLPRPERWEEVKRAVDWVCWADRQYPCVYSRLEFGFSWESSTRQLLGFEGLPPFSALRGLNLQKTVPQVLVH
ncbi:uncharacterized protein LOC117481322 [Trematomus bernacchii]|uniref:uncharacterized protein LOC117481322 n=1 Tax=Trematomus bernacchii TaxID=40690 RepID=UPI00146D5530|nr:uncharacterized protein LOC117481322 [Trematomus bernacchii]